MRFLITPELDGIGIYPFHSTRILTKPLLKRPAGSIGYFPRAARINRLASTALVICVNFGMSADNVGSQLKPSGIFTLGTDWTF
jgi:hypothetical protein